MVKRVLLLCAVSILSPLMVSGQTRLLETFTSTTFPPTGWSLEYSGLLYWSRSTTGGYGLSTGSAAFEFFNAPATTTQSLVSKSFTATGASDTLVFDHAYATYLDEVDSLIIETSTDGGTTFARLVALPGGTALGTGMVTAPPSFFSFTPSSSQWSSKRYHLPAGVNKLKFKAVSDFGNNLYLDNIKVFSQLGNDVGVVSIDYPAVYIDLPFLSSPTATIKNFGLNEQSELFEIIMRITGPGSFNYFAVQTDTLSPGLTRPITFEPSFSPTLPGTYNVTVYTRLVTDSDRTNDTLRTSVPAQNYSYGNNGGVGNALYYFANSLPGNGAPSQPPFNWHDTTGSTDLIVNGAAIASITGDTDDGYFTISGIMPGKSFRFFGVDYSGTLYISTNGIISFVAGTTAFSPSAIPSASLPNAAIYPLWMDLDFSDGDVALNRLSYKSAGDELIVTYAQAPRYNIAASPADFVSFQVLLRFSETPTLNSTITVQYDATRTGAEFLAGYTTNAFAHLVGIENETGTSALTYRRVSVNQPVVHGPVFSSSLAVAFGPDNTVLPIQLASFTALSTAAGVLLEWITISELNNYGFLVQRRAAHEHQFTEIPGSFVPGHGTTTVPQYYSYTDSTVQSGRWFYRLRQVDLDGTSHFSEEIEVDVTTDVETTVPVHFSLSQNYPNPFNPSTVIRFSVEQIGPATLLVYNVLGENVATLFDDVAEAGRSYSAHFNGSDFASGVYFFRLRSGMNSDVKKMMLLR